MRLKSTLIKSLAGRASSLWAVCSVANPRHSLGYGRGLRLAAHPKARRAPSRGLDQGRLKASGALFTLLLSATLLVGGCATGPAALPESGPATGPDAVVLPTAPAAPRPEPTLDPSPAPVADESGSPALPQPPRGRFDPEQDAERSSLWDRIRSRWAIADLHGDRIPRWEQFYARQPDYVHRMVTRGGRYLFHIVEEVERRNLPAELALLPFIESAFNPQAHSHASASGMWQFMPATGKDFELRQNIFRDDRRDVLASTRAALDYLQRLHGLFGDWHLALAAYNWGQGNVQRAIDRNRRAGLGTGYADLSMPDETRNYVPKLQAVKNIVARPRLFAVTLPPLENHPYFLSVNIERDIDVALAARLAGLSIDDFKQLNPQMNKPVILAAGTPQVLLPYDNANRFIRELPLVRGALASWTAWVAPRTLKPSEAAHLVGMTEAQLRDVNRIPARMLVKAGSTLLVPRGALAKADVAGHLADHAALALTPEARALRRVSFKAGKQGDSVAAVAKRYRLKPDEVAQWNGVAGTARFKPGQAVTVMLASAPPKAAARTTSAARPSATRATRKSAVAAAPRTAGKPATRTRTAQIPQAGPR